MIDERGRGGVFPPGVEDICALKLAVSILEAAIEDRAFLDAMQVDKYTLRGYTHISIDELDSFAKSEWGKFLAESVDCRLVSIRTAKMRGEARARPHVPGRRPRLLLPYKGEKHTIAEWAEIAGVSEGYVYDRWYSFGRHGDEDWLDAGKLKTARRFDWGGRMLKVRDIAYAEGVTPAQLHYRLGKGLTIEEAVRTSKACREKRVVGGNNEAE